MSSRFLTEFCVNFALKIVYWLQKKNLKVIWNGRALLLQTVYIAKFIQAWVCKHQEIILTPTPDLTWFNAHNFQPNRISKTVIQKQCHQTLNILQTDMKVKQVFTMKVNNRINYTGYDHTSLKNFGHNSPW